MTRRYYATTALGYAAPDAETLLHRSPSAATPAPRDVLLEILS
jgi:hypothetical protein